MSTVTGRIAGKALLVIDKQDSRYIPYVVRPLILTPYARKEGENWAHEGAQEDIEACFISGHIQIGAMKRMAVGDRIRLAVTYELIYSRDYWGEHDVDLELHRCRLLRYQKGKP